MVFWWENIQFFKMIRLKRDFQFSCSSQVITWYIHASKLKFSTYVENILGILQENEQSNGHRLIEKRLSFNTKLGKNEKSLTFRVFLTNFTLWKFLINILSIRNLLHKLCAGNTTVMWKIKLAYASSNTLILSLKIEEKIWLICQNLKFYEC